ncbi:MAG TPA: hypothetical protein VEB59_05225 [Gemmatimonadales bacterium]|nr:hypothetical protein [Gemmatimonadales bacterium]
MSPRKPTIDGLDDTDDEDGVLEEETQDDNDLTLHEEDETQVGLGHTPPGRDPYVEDRKEDTR